jgi:hypothetical protein
MKSITTPRSDEDIRKVLIRVTRGLTAEMGVGFAEGWKDVRATEARLDK